MKLVHSGTTNGIWVEDNTRLAIWLRSHDLNDNGVNHYFDKLKQYLKREVIVYWFRDHEGDFHFDVQKLRK